jgi:hypothetical protein
MGFLSIVIISYSFPPLWDGLGEAFTTLHHWQSATLQFELHSVQRLF